MKLLQKGSAYMKTRKNIFLMMFIFLLAITGCTNEKISMNSEAEIMNVSLEQIEQIRLFSNGIESKVDKNSQYFLQMAKSIKENENSAHIIDGGTMLIMNVEGKDYVELSADIESEIYVIDLQEGVVVTYSDYASKDKKIISLFILPKQGEFGCVIDGGENGRVSFATFSDVEKNFFEEIKK